MLAPSTANSLVVAAETRGAGPRVRADASFDALLRVRRTTLGQGLQFSGSPRTPKRVDCVCVCLDVRVHSLSSALHSSGLCPDSHTRPRRKCSSKDLCIGNARGAISGEVSFFCRQGVRPGFGPHLDSMEPTRLGFGPKSPPKFEIQSRPGLTQPAHDLKLRLSHGRWFRRHRCPDPK